MPIRRLIRIPIVHTARELGSLSASVRERYLRRFGPTGWNDRERAVRELWKDISEDIERLRLDFAAVRLYQDGLPVCGFEEKIVRELAGAGSLNHQILLDLMGRGSTLMGTEDPQLLIQEYEMHKPQPPGNPGSAATAAQRSQEAERLLQARDRFIVARIDQTLLAGETGLLFLGAAHPLDGFRATDLLVEVLGDRDRC